MIGYKAFNSDLTCKGFQYGIGKTFEFDGEIKLCDAGFHFCENIADCFSYYPRSSARFAKVEALGKVIRSDNNSKCVTDKIRIIEEIPIDEAIKMTNTGYGNVGGRNSGRQNTGNRNTGNENSGNGNSGNKNTGNGNVGNDNTGSNNTGNQNTGDWNCGDQNIGDWNIGNWNVGNCNTGYWNIGECNAGDRNSGNSNTGTRNGGNRNSGSNNTGDRNTGDWNAGHWNTGNSNTGNLNTGFCNAGDRNTGDFNKSSSNNGCFMTVKPTIMMFNKPSNWTLVDWRQSEAYRIMHSYPVDCTDSNWVISADMTDEEKEKHPEYKITGGYLKVVKYKRDKQKWWDELSDFDKQVVMGIPNFDADVFFECTGIRV